MNIPLTVIIETPMEEFNDLLSSKDITEEQVNIRIDIRRRGKNKVRNKFGTDSYLKNWDQYK